MVDSWRRRTLADHTLDVVVDQGARACLATTQLMVSAAGEARMLAFADRMVGSGGDKQE
jgi:hypothetical protein